jgi:hypothetical protein
MLLSHMGDNLETVRSTPRCGWRLAEPSDARVVDVTAGLLAFLNLVHMLPMPAAVHAPALSSSICRFPRTSLPEGKLDV